MRSLLILAAWTASAVADELPTIESAHPPAIRLSTGVWGETVDRFALHVQTDDRPSWIEIAVRARRVDNWVDLPLDLPAGTHILGISVRNDEGMRWGRTIAPTAAKSSGATTRIVWEGVSAEQDHVMISTVAPATLELAVVLPPAPRIAIDVAARIDVAIDDAPARTWKPQKQPLVVELPPLAAASAESFVSPDSSLIVARDIVAVSCCNTIQSRWLDKSTIRRVVRNHTSQLRRCYTQELPRNPVEGTANLHFLITTDGSVGSATVDGDLPAPVNDCLRALVEQFGFPETDGDVVVNYPLRFELDSWSKDELAQAAAAR